MEDNIKATILFAVLNSHEIVRRQIEWFRKMELPDDVEILIMDDGSEPPITGELKNLRIVPTNDFRPWTQPLARNAGAKIAKGEYIICTDIDFIITKELINTVLEGTYDVIRFKREVGVLDELSNFTQDVEQLGKYGFPVDRIERRGLRLSAHSNSYAMKRELFIRLGGSQSKPSYPNQDEVRIKHRFKKLAAQGEITIIPDNDRPTIYMIPNGRFCGDKDYNPFGLFHNLTRKEGWK
jgi:glycosyltransferase involved in cell wall biosynthesis